nr:MupG family TIM beta-alpha barrel fold protein [Borrelia sp. BU AG58]
MREIGISIYPNVSSKNKIIEYLEKSAALGFTRVFASLIYTDGNEFDTFKEVLDIAKKWGMKPTVDVNPNIFKKLNIDLTDLRNCLRLDYFKKLGAWAIRIDCPFTGIEESLMTFNDSNLKIELNISSINEHINTIMFFKPNKDNLLGCHNFYPHKYTGLSRNFFRTTTKAFRQNSIPTSAFVSSIIAEKCARGVEKDGAPTLEEHRNKDIELQTKDLFKEGMSTIIISNCFPDDLELKKMAKVNRYILELRANLNPKTNPIEREIILDNLHFNRGDITPYRIRSTMPRMYYKDTNFIIHSPDEIKRGDLLIDSSKYLGYSGELQIALKDTPNNGLINVVGRIHEEELYLLDAIEPWEKFKIIENN